MRSLRSIVATLVVALAFCAFAPAQISRIAGSGCANAPFPVPSPTTPKIGTTVTFNGRLCPGRMPGFFLFGVAPVKIPVGPPVTCSNNCVLATLPLLFLQSSWVKQPIPIPNDRRLVGACFYVQTGCVSVRRCLELDGALKVCITA